jgi:hypothetical protein
VRKFLHQFTDTKGDALLRQLLSHTAGFPDYQPGNVHRDDYQTLEESVAQVVALPAPAKPGEGTCPCHRSRASVRCWVGVCSPRHRTTGVS